ncbi:MAG: succinate--CoA ligase subunit alpha [Candidatus Bipolaricaulota bacterium]|nr:MAG: succinate--CoA ligase subunit alpha [Candidatus Bipolaricaulota bacterium]
MSILVGSQTQAVVQGITGNEGRFHTKQMLDYGTKIVAGVTPGKGGQSVEGVPVFDTVSEAVSASGADASIVFVPPRFAADAVMEAAEAGVGLVVCLTEGIPAHDMIVARRYVDLLGVRLIGPNTPGVISPGRCKLGVMAGYIHREGPVGIVSRSGTLTYEVVHQLSAVGIGQSTCVGIGGDQIIGLSFPEILALFEDDGETEGIILIGEIGGSAEEEAAALIAERIAKPVVAFIAGQTAPPGRRMGHAGAIITGSAGTAGAKIAALREAGAAVADSPARIGALMAERLSA